MLYLTDAEKGYREDDGDVNRKSREFCRWIKCNERTGKRKSR